MKSFSKTASIVLAAVLMCVILVLISSVTYAASNEIGIITADSVTAEAGETVDVTLTITNNPGIAGMVMGISYDTEALSLTSVSNGSVMGSMTAGKNVVLTNTPQSEKDGTLLTLTFAVSDTAEPGDYTVSCTVYECSNSNEEAVELDVVAGKVTVPAPEHTHTWGRWQITRVPGVKNAGELRRTCTTDHTHIDVYKLPSLSDVYYTVKNLIEAGCETDGRDNYSITVDGEKFDFEVRHPARGHSWGDWKEDKAPTYSNYGEEHRVCKHDDHVERRPKDRLQALVSPSVNKNNDGSYSSHATVSKDDVVIIPDDNRVNVDTSSGDENVNASTSKLQSDFIEAIKDMELEVNNDVGSIVLDAIATGKLADSGTSVDVGIKEITTEEQREKGKKVFSITVNDEGGNALLPPEHTNNGKITLSFIYKKGMHKDWINIEYIDDHGNRERREVKDYDPKTGRVTFETNHLSDYEISGIDLPELSGMYLNLDDSINVHYTAVIPEDFENPYIVFEMLGQEYTQDRYTLLDDGRYSFRFEDVSPQYMGEVITATLYASKDGIEYNVSNDSMSIRAYCEYTLEEYASNGTLVRLLSDLLVYGEKAQLYVGYDVDNLVTSGMTLAPTEYTAPTNAFGVSGEADENVDWVGFGLNFSDTINSYLTFVASDVTNLRVKISINGRNTSYDVSELEVVSANKYKIYLNDIMAYELDDIITATLERNGEQIGRSLTYSVKTYACYLETIGASDDLTALVRAVCNYGSSAYQYNLETEDAQ